MKLEKFAVIVWHNNDINGTHQRVIARGYSATSAMLDFAKYLQRPQWCRSFTHKNKVQLHGPDGLICDLPMIEA